MAKHGVTKTLLSKQNLNDSSKILVGDVKVMPNKVLKVSRPYMQSFLSYRENMQGVIPTPQRCAATPQ